jgi:phage tail-like protein
MMPGQALFSAPAAAVTAASTQRSPKGKGNTVQYGMTMWFRVVVDGMQNLGEWSGCSGLGVKFTVDQVKEGINHDSPRIVPNGLTYGEITLERAMTSADSTKVREWLESVTAGWVNGPEGGAPSGAAGSAAGFAGTTITVTLYSAVRPSRTHTPHKVAEWKLRDAYPVAWAGPTLSSKSNDVAIEKLTLAHSGFLEPGGSKKSPASAGQGLLRLTDEAMNTLPLQYNPEKVSMDKSVTIKDNSTGTMYVKDEQVTEPGKMSFSFEVRVEGVSAVAKATAQLWDWLEPQEGGWVKASPSGKPAQKGPELPNRGLAPVAGERKPPGKPANTSKPKVLTIHIGSGTNAIQRNAVLKKVNTSFTRFTGTGEPSRATISITLEEKETKPKKTNPTSGGPPGGRVHTVLEGDSLPTVATAAYGSPGAWREVAEHNGIDDPLRLRNGSPLYLPGA